MDIEKMKEKVKKVEGEPLTKHWCSLYNRRGKMDFERSLSIWVLFLQICSMREVLLAQ